MEITDPDAGKAAEPAPAALTVPNPDEKADRMRAHYSATASTDPVQATDTLRREKKTGLSREYLAADPNRARVIEESVSPDFFKDVQDGYPDTATLLAQADSMAKVRDDLPNVAAHEPIIKNHTQVTSQFLALKAGLEGSVFGHIYRRDAPETVAGPDTTFGQGLTEGAVSMALDFPFMVIGGVGATLVTAPVAGPAAVLASGPGAFALPSLLKTSVAEYYRTGDHSGFSNAMEKSWNVAKATGKSAMVGLITELTGGLVNKATIGTFLPTAEQAASMTLKQMLAKFGATQTAQTAAGGAVEGQMPTARDLGLNLALGVGMEGAHRSGMRVFDGLQARATESYLHGLDELAVASKWRTRDPEGYAAHLNKMSPPARIPLEDFNKAFENGEIAAGQLGLEAAYAEAKLTGGDVVVPMGTFMSASLDKQRAALNPSAKLDPEARSTTQLAVQAEEDAKAAEKAAASPADKVPEVPAHQLVNDLPGPVVTGEAIPSKDIGHPIFSASFAVKTEFSQRAVALLRDEHGDDKIAQSLGIVPLKTEASNGAYGGNINPNFVTAFPAGTDPAKVAQYARAIQYIFKQDAVPFFGVQEGGPTQGFHINFKEALNPESESAFFEALKGGLTEAVGYTKLSDKTLVILDFNDTPDIEAKIDEFAANYEQIESVRRFRASSEYGPDHNWGSAERPHAFGSPVLPPDALGQAFQNEGLGDRSPASDGAIRDARLQADKLLEEYSGPGLAAREQALAESSGTPLSADNKLAERELATMLALSEARAQIGQSGEAPAKDMPPELAAMQAKLEHAAAKEAESILLAPQIAEMKRDAVAELARLTAQAEVEIAGEPLYEAQDALRRSIGIENETFTEAPVRTAAEKVLSGEVGDEQLFMFQNAAEQFGYSSAEELAHAISDSLPREQAIKALAESRMTKDLRQTPQMRAEALKALHTEKSAELLSVKQEIMVGMARRTERDQTWAAGIRDRARETARQARVLAEKLIGSKPVTDAGSFRTYYTAERDAAVRAAKATAKGDYEGASLALHQQLAAHALASEALRVRGEIEANVNSLLKLQRAKKSTYGEQDQFVQAASILSRFGFEHREFNVDQKVESLSQWVSRIEEYDMGVSIPNWIQNETTSKSWKELTPSQLQDVRNSVKNIKKMDSDMKKALTVERGAEIDHIAEQLHENKVASGLSGKTPGAGTAETKWQKTVKTKDFVRQGLLTKETIFAVLGKKWGDTLFEPLMRAEDKLGEASADMNSKYEALHKGYSEKERAEMDSKGIFIPEFNDTLTKENLIRLWMHQGTEGNQSKVLSVKRKDVQWTQEMVELVLNRELTKRDMDLGQARLDLINSMKPDILAFNKRVSGFEPEMVKGQVIKSVHGEYAGGYSPLTHDPRVTGESFEAYSADQMIGSVRAGQAMTDRGYTKTREANAKYAVSLDSNDIIRHMDDVLRDIHLREWVIDANRILGHKTVAADVADAFGKPQYDNIREWVKRVAGNTQDPARHWVEVMSAEARRRSTIFLLAGKVTSMLRQLDFTVAAGVDPKNFGVKKIAASISETYGAMVRGESSFAELKDFVLGKSEYMRQRQPGYDRDLMDAMRSKLGNNTKLVKIANVGFGLMDRIVTHSIWKGAYKVGLGLNDGDEAAAIAYADRTIRKSNPPGRLSAMSDAMSTSELGKLLTMFAGQSERQLNLMYEAQHRVNGARDVPALIGTGFAVMIVPALLGSLISVGLPDSEEKRRKWKKNVALEPFQGIPLFKSGMEVGLDAAFGLKGKAALSPATGMFQAYQDMTAKFASSKATKLAKIEAASKVAAYTGLPIPGHFMQPIPSQYLSWFWNSVDVMSNGMEPQASDLLRRRQADKRRVGTY